MKRIQVKLFVGLCLGAAALAAAPAPDEAALQRRIGYADYYVREFEKEVALQRGGEKMVWRNQRTALEKVRELKVEYPDDPRVDALFRRVSTSRPSGRSTSTTRTTCASSSRSSARRSGRASSSRTRRA